MGIDAEKHESLITFADGLIFFLLDTGGVEEKSAALSAACWLTERQPWHVLADKLVLYISFYLN